MTQRLHVIGDPISHSLSPIIHALWLEIYSLDAEYTAKRVTPESLSATLIKFWQDGVLGLNVTLPHKQAVLEASSVSSKAAIAIGAANTLTRRNEGGWTADNTDAAGFLVALEHAGADDLAGRQVTVIGAGGAARACVFAMHHAGARLTIVNRTLERAEALSSEITAGTAAAAPIDQLFDVAASADLVVNTTSSGHSGNVLSLPDGSGRLFMDISYGAAASKQIKVAAVSGWRTEDGLAMLVAQAAESFHTWFGIKPEIAPALKVCRAALEASE